MDRQEALDHFSENYVDKKSVEMMNCVEEYLEKNKDELVPDFVESFRQICLKIKEMQVKGEKGKIAYITYSLLLTNIAERKYAYVVDAYNTLLFYDNAQCRSEYDVSWAFNYLDQFEMYLEEKRKLYIDKLTKADVDQLRLGEVNIYNDCIIELARYAMPYAIKIKEYEEIEKEEVVEIRVGKYKGVSDIVYMDDKRVKDSKEIKKWLEEKEGSYRNEVLKNLDLSGGDYEGIKLSRGDLSGSNLSNCNLKGCSFIGTKFIDCNIKNSDLSEAIIDEAIFSNADLTNSFFLKTGGGHINFSYSNLENVKFIQVDMVKCDMKKANLKNADMKMSELIAFNFEGANLDGTNFENSILEKSDFRGVIFNNVNFKGANLKKAVFLKKDIQNLDLDEEQKSMIIIEN